MVADPAQNWAAVAALGAAPAVLWVVEPNTFPMLIWSFDHLIAFIILRPLLVPIIKHNTKSTAGISDDVAALRAASAFGIVTILVHLFYHILGRTVLLSIVGLHVCVQLQKKCWTAAVSLHLQREAAI